MSTVIDLNREVLADRPINRLVNELIERAAPTSENYRHYLGASSIGSECLRKVQYDWMCDPVFPVRTKDIFARGHFFEELTRQHLIAVGFEFAPKERLRFQAANGFKVECATCCGRRWCRLDNRDRGRRCAARARLSGAHNR